MAKFIVFLICSFYTFSINAQSLIGAWEATITSQDGDKLRSVWIFADGYQALTTYDAATGEFLNTKGGTWDLKGDVITELIEFNTDNGELVGEEINIKIAATKDLLQIGDSKVEYKRIDNGKPGVLNGAWLMSGRVRNGETQLRDIDKPRKTMKILSGTRFQWIAYNTETKQFMGTGGGTYTTINGEYTETIEFFSKDNSKVGISLKFNYKLIDGKWHHSGFSSKGDPIQEIWSKRN